MMLMNEKEDPMEDMKYLNIGPEDSMFVITSAGDNALHYAISARPKRVNIFHTIYTLLP